MDYLMSQPQFNPKNTEIMRQMHDFAEIDITENEFIDLLEVSMMPIQQFFTYYKCAIMEIETKFKVLNEQFSLNGESNPIEFIQSRIKSYGSILRKISDKDIQRSLDGIETHIHDVAGIRVVCSFVQDIYRLAGTEGLYSESEAERLQKFAFNCSSSDLFGKRKTACQSGGPASDACNGFLGKPGA